MSAQSDYKALMALIMSPQFAMLTGSYDPMQMVGQTADQLPLTQMYVNGQDQLMSQIAAGISSGQLTPQEAVNQLRKAVDNGSTSMTYADVDSVVKQLQDEVTQNAIHKQNAQADSPWAKAGLPNPMDQYTAHWDPARQAVDTNLTADMLGATYNDLRSRAGKTQADASNKIENGRRNTEMSAQNFADSHLYLGKNWHADGFSNMEKVTKALQPKLNAELGSAAPDLQMLFTNYLNNVRKDDFKDTSKTHFLSQADLVDMLKRGGLNDSTAASVAQRWLTADTSIPEMPKQIAASKSDPIEKQGWAKIANAFGAPGSKASQAYFQLVTNSPEFQAVPNNGLEQVAAGRAAAKDAKLWEQKANGEALGRTLLAQMLGRTPYGDAVQQRMLLAKQLGLA